MISKLLFLSLLVIFTNGKHKKDNYAPFKKTVKVHPRRRENNNDRPKSHKTVDKNTLSGLPKPLPEELSFHSQLVPKIQPKKPSEDRDLQFWRRRGRHSGNRRRGIGQLTRRNVHGHSQRLHSNIPPSWVRPHWWLADQHVSVGPDKIIQGINHSLPNDARVNLFRVNCRIFGNCTHISTHRSSTFHPEILAASRRPPLMTKTRDKPERPMTGPDMDEEMLRKAVHDPTDELVNHLTQFGRDRRVTLWVQSLFRQGRLPHDLNNLDLIDRNYFVGTHRLIGNTRITEQTAITRMNYEQYFRHKELTIGRAMNHQQLVTDFGNSKTDYTHMMTFRRQRQIVYESILQMENVIYMEQNSLIQNIKQRRNKFDETLRQRIKTTMKELEGKPYYPMIFDRNDIFRDN